MLAASENCTAAVEEGGALYVCGHDSEDTHGSGNCGRLGHSLGKDIDVLTIVTGGLSGKHVVSVSLGPFHGAAATTDGEVFTWGLGLVTPTLVHGGLTGKRVLSVSACEGFNLAMTDEGEIWAWGSGNRRPPGLGEINPDDGPTRVEGGLVGKHVIGISASYSHCAAVTACGEVFTWGSGSEGSLGHGNEENMMVPTRVEGAPRHACIVDVSFEGGDRTAAVTKDGELFVWGTSYDYTLPGGSMTLVPTLVGGELTDERVMRISLGSYHMVAVTDTGGCYTWGAGGWGRLGHGDNEHIIVPTLVTGALSGERVVDVAAGSLHTAAVTLEGDLYTWEGGSQELVEASEMSSYSDLCKLGLGPIDVDDEDWYYLPRLVSARWWSVDRSLLMWSRETHARFPRAFRNTVGALLMAMKAHARRATREGRSAASAATEAALLGEAGAQSSRLWVEGFVAVVTSEPALLVRRGSHAESDVGLKSSSPAKSCDNYV